MEYPRFLVRGECGRTLPCENFFYCAKCQKILSKYKAKKDISFYFNPQKIETVAQNTKRSYGKNPDEKICPVCNIVIKDTDYALEIEGKKTLISYYKCKFCLWNTMHYNTTFESKGLNKFTTELYRRHKYAREVELAESITYMQEKLRMTNKTIFDAQYRARKARASMIGFTTQKTKGPWDMGMLYDKWNNSKNQTLATIVTKEHSRRLKKNSIRIFRSSQLEEEIVEDKKDETEDEIKLKEDEDDKKSESESSDSSDSQEASGLPRKEVTEALADYMDSLTGSPTRLDKDPNINMEEIEKKVNEIFKDNEPLLTKEYTQHESIDDFLNDYKPQDIKSNMFEQLPTKTYRGYDSLIAINSLLIPIINKSCPIDSCKNGLVYYETSSESFNMKFHSGLSDYMPIFRLHKVIPGQEFTTFNFIMRNRTKYSCRVIFKIPEKSSTIYKFKNGALEVDQQLTTSDKEGGSTKAGFEVEVQNGYYGDVVLEVDINLVMHNTENLVVRFEMVLQLGDEDAQKSYLGRYYQK